MLPDDRPLLPAGFVQRHGPPVRVLTAVPRWLAGLALLSMAGFAQSASPLVAVASNLSDPLQRLATQFTVEAGERVTLSFGSSGNLTRQILQGARYELFIAAGGDYVERLQAAGRVASVSVTLAHGRICAFVPDRSRLRDSGDLRSLARSLAGGDYRRLALPNPEHAPYGIAAQQALQRLGVWALDRRRVLLAENAAQAVQFSLSGDLDLGMIPLSFARMAALTGRGRCLEIPAAWHDPLPQKAVLLNAAGAGARRFLAFLSGPGARAVFADAGYDLPAARP